MSDGPASTRLDRQTLVARLVSLLLLTTLAASIVYAAIRLADAPVIATEPGMRTQSDYTLMLIQCAGGLLVMFLPNFIQRQFSVKVPTGMQIAYFGFLYAAIYLGEVRSFYVRYAHWDTVLHFFSGAMLGALGFLLVRLLNDAEGPRISLGAGFMAFFAFCFAVASGTAWEIYEFIIDGAFGTDMQKFVTETGETLVGREALTDTMGDLVTDALAALAVTLVGYVGLRRGDRRSRLAPGTSAEGELRAPSAHPRGEDSATGTAPLPLREG